MKAAIFAVLLLIGADLTLNHGAGLRRFGAGLANLGEGIGAWVFYPS